MSPNGHGRIHVVAYDRVCEICSGLYATTDPDSFICDKCKGMGFDETDQRRQLVEEIRRARFMRLAEEMFESNLRVEREFLEGFTI